MYTAITREPLSADTVLAHVRARQDGAVVVFLGTVRDHNEGRAVRGVAYEAYEAMAAQVLRDIAQEAAARADSDRMAVVHRVGELEIGEVSVAIAVSTPHRAEAFEAARYVIEEIKRRLPVWKQEHYAEGEARWLDGAVPPAEGAA